MQPIAGNEASLNMGGVRDIADLKVINDYKTVEEYEAFLKQEFELV